MNVLIGPLQLLAICVFSWWHAHKAGRYWTEVKIVRGWSKTIVYLAVISSAAGFTAVYSLIILLLVLGSDRLTAEGLMPGIGHGWAAITWLFVIALLLLPLEKMIAVWRRRYFGEPSLAGYGEFDIWLAAWRETADTPGVFRSVTRFVHKSWRWFKSLWSQPRIGRGLPDSDPTAVATGQNPPSIGRDGPAAVPPLNVEATPLDRGVTGGKAPKSAGASPLRTSQPPAAPPISPRPAGAGLSAASRLGSGGRGVGDGQPRGSSFNFDGDSDDLPVLLLVAAVIIALSIGVMTTVAIVRSADRQHALNVLEALA